MNKDKPENNTILKLQERGDGVTFVVTQPIESLT